MTDDRKSGADEERMSLEDWAADETAPPSLRVQTVRAARARGLVKGVGMSRSRVWIGMGAAAAALTFVLGFGLGTRQGSRAGAETAPQAASGTAAPEATGPRYALFLFEDASYRSPSADQMPSRIGEYAGWARGLGRSGRYVTGDKLGGDGRWCRLENGSLSADGPLADSRRGVLTGYFVIGAASLEEALEVARGCPHLKYGGSVEVRPIET